MFKRFLGRKQVPLTGAPTVRRLKTYSAQSGYVYQYFYTGHRPFANLGDTGTEFVFDVSADRKQYHPVSVYVSTAAVRAWEENHGRALIANEHYAAAKMALFQSFDERETPEQMAKPVHVRPADLEALLATLGLD